MAPVSRVWERFKGFFIQIFGNKSARVAETPAVPAAESATLPKPPGLDCPKCNFRIMISVPMLLSGETILCPGCGLHLSVNKEQSQACLNELKKVYDAIQKAEEAKENIR